ncbi:MAG: AMIN domain-containing protein, partial [Colwellia sp.]|nr:AMIN domain-containing protein [Colwellia sp.]
MRLLSLFLTGLCWLLIAIASVTVKSSLAANSIEGIRVWPAPENTRIVFDLTSKPEFKYFSLAKPDRLVIDFKNTKNNTALKALADNDPRIKLLRTSTAKSKSDTRLVLELAKSYQLTVFPLAPAGQYGNRLVVDLYDEKNKVKTVKKTTLNGKRDIIIAIVAGHGGEDPGSIGANGSYEKRVTLAIAKKLAALINKRQGFK